MILLVILGVLTGNTLIMPVSATTPDFVWHVSANIGYTFAMATAEGYYYEENGQQYVRVDVWWGIAGPSIQYWGIFGFIIGKEFTIVESDHPVFNHTTVTWHPVIPLEGEGSGAYGLGLSPLWEESFYIIFKRIDYGSSVVWTELQAIIWDRGHQLDEDYDFQIIDLPGDAGTSSDAGDTFSAATEIIADGSNYKGGADKTNDPNDYYKFNVPYTGALISITMTPPSGYDYDLYLYDPSGTLKAFSMKWGDATESISYTADSTGYWRIRIYVWQYNGVGVYTFKAPIIGSCPYIYAWNGTKFNFMADVLGPGGLAYPDVSLRYDFRAPNPHDFAVIPGEMLQAVNGTYVIELAEHASEIAYIDAVRLVAVDHPVGYEIYSPTVMTQIPLPFEYRTAYNPISPITAAKYDYLWDQLVGTTDVSDSISTPDDLDYAVANVDEFHMIELDFGDLGDLADISEFKLITRGWMTFTDDPVGDVLWIQQHPETARAPYIEVINEYGEWEAVGESICNESFWEGHGMPRTMMRDIKHWLKTSDYRLRLHYWGGFNLDWIAVDITDTPYSQTTFTVLEPTVANLYYKGGVESIPVEGDVLGRYPAVPDWDIPYNHDTELFIGYFTRYGNVKPLLRRSDDMFVIMNYGDSIHLEFPEVSMPEGMERDYYFFVDGYFKLPYVKYFLNNTVSTVDPLPFHAMTTYPYPEDESYPDDPIHQAYLRVWNTRYIGPD